MNSRFVDPPRGKRDDRERRWDTRVGTIGLAIPKVRDGSYFPSLLELGGEPGGLS